MTYQELQKNLKKAAPKTTLNWELHLKKKRKKHIIILLIIIIILSIWYGLKYRRAESQSALTHALIATKELEKGHQIKEKDLTIIKFAKNQLPENYYQNKDDLIDMFIVQDIAKKSIITDKNIIKYVKNNSLALKLDRESMAFTINGTWLESKLPKVNEGDNVSILISNPKREVEDTNFIIQNSEIIDFKREAKSNSSDYITIKVNPDEARNLLYAKSQKLLFEVVLTP